MTIQDIYFFTMSATYILPQGGLQFLETEIPEGKFAKSVDVGVTPNIPIYEDIPKTEQEISNEKIAELEEENANINYALMMEGIL